MSPKPSLRPTTLGWSSSATAVAGCEHARGAVVDDGRDGGAGQRVADVLEQAGGRAGDQVGRQQQHAVGAFLLGQPYARPCHAGAATGADPDRDATSGHLGGHAQHAAHLLRGQRAELTGPAGHEQRARAGPDVALDLLTEHVEVDLEGVGERGERKGQQTGRGRRDVVSSHALSRKDRLSVDPQILTDVHVHERCHVIELSSGRRNLFEKLVWSNTPVNACQDARSLATGFGES